MYYINRERYTEYNNNIFILYINSHEIKYMMHKHKKKKS